MIDSMFFIATPAAGGGASFLTSQLPLFVIMGLIMYFLLIRPQQQQRKKHQEMLNNLKKNDWVITSGGLIGKIVKLADDEMTLDLGDSQVRVLRSMIVDVRNKDGSKVETKPAKETKSKES